MLRSTTRLVVMAMVSLTLTGCWATVSDVKKVADELINAKLNPVKQEIVDNKASIDLSLGNAKTRFESAEKRLGDVETGAQAQAATTAQIRKDFNELVVRVEKTETAVTQALKNAGEAKGLAEKAQKDLDHAQVVLLRMINSEQITRKSADEATCKMLTAAIKARQEADAKGEEVSDNLRKQIALLIKEAKLADQRAKAESEARQAVQVKVAGLSVNQQKTAAQVSITIAACNEARQAAEEAKQAQEAAPYYQGRTGIFGRLRGN